VIKVFARVQNEWKDKKYKEYHWKYISISSICRLCNQLKEWCIWKKQLVILFEFLLSSKNKKKQSFIVFEIEKKTVVNLVYLSNCLLFFFTLFFCFKKKSSLFHEWQDVRDL